ncbi:MAG: hypothetical protein J2P17_01045 [Mycobacterium sp.]|nr:hypothetical protein [Mycobacterium sp.]
MNKTPPGISTPVYVTEDITKCVWVTCPNCGQETKTRGNAVGVWMLPHWDDERDRRCPTSDRPVETATAIDS